METEQFNKTPRKATFWFRTFIVLALLYGATFSLISFFNWIFFFGAVYALFMSYFLLPVQPKIFQGNAGRSRQSRQWQGKDQSFDTEAQVVTPQDRAKKIVLTVVISFFGLFFLLMVIGFLSDDPEEQNTNSTTSEESSGDDSSDDGSSDDSDASYSGETTPAALVNRGNEFFNNKEYDSANAYYDKALELDGSYMEAVYGKGIVLYNKGSIDEANTAFLRAYEGGFRYAWLSWALADMYDKQGQAMRAVEFYKESVGLDSSYVDSYKRLAELDPSQGPMYLELAEKHKQ